MGLGWRTYLPYWEIAVGGVMRFDISTWFSTLGLNEELISNFQPYEEGDASEWACGVWHYPKLKDYREECRRVARRCIPTKVRVTTWAI